MSAQHRRQFDRRLRSRGGQLGCVVASVVVLMMGCASPQAYFVGSPAGALPVTNPSTSASSTATTNSQPNTSVVRSQNNNDPYAPGTDDHFRGPMTPAAQPNTANQWTQYQAPINNSSWNGDYPAPSAAPSWTTTPAPNSSKAALWNNTPTAQTPPPWNSPPTSAVTSPATPTTLAQWSTPAPPPPGQPPSSAGVTPPTGVAPTATLNSPVYGPPTSAAQPPGMLGLPTPMTDIIVNVAEAQTGRLLIGAAVNSDAGLTGQIILDEKNFDWRRIPTSWDDLPTAFRGGGQGFRIEALPGNQVQRYMVQFTEPYLLNTRVSFNLSGFLFDRRFFDWDEARLGGRIGLGYRVTPDLSVQLGVRLESVEITDPRVPGVAELDAAVGSHELYGIRASITHDTRDIPFAPTQGHYVDLTFEQVLGSFDYSRASLDLRRYFLVTERPDGSGRHVLGFSNRMYITGSQTPIYENYFAGGYSTLRGFDFRGATPKVSDVSVGGELMLLGSVEYRCPITADDALQGVVFCDYGTVEEEIDIDYDDYRVSLGAGLRIAIPALSAAPIALDFAVPINRESTDDIQNFAFFVGVSR